MGFTQPCFIKKNTPELRAKLEKIGYKKDYCFEGNLPFIYIGDYSDCGLGPLYSEANYGAPILFSTNFKRIDCKENEELFLSLAALRDDAPDYQWFLWEDNDGIYHTELEDSWRKYIPNEKWEEWWWFEVRKASVKEIIEHFK